MRSALSAGAAIVALALAACSTTAPPAAEPDRKTERAPDTLPDAYKHPPK
jgi:hypothetical protein